MTPLGIINGSTYLKKDNSLRKRSKCVKINSYVEQISGKKSTVFWSAPCAKTYTRGVMSPHVARFEGAQPLALIAVLVWLLRGCRLHQFVCLGESQCPHTAAPQLCTLCEHAVLANLVNPIKLGGSARLRGRCPKWAWFRKTKGSSPGEANHGLE